MTKSYVTRGLGLGLRKGTVSSADIAKGDLVNDNDYHAVDLKSFGVPASAKLVLLDVVLDDAAGANTMRFKIFYYFKYLNKKQQTRIISQLQ